MVVVEMGIGKVEGLVEVWGRLVVPVDKTGDCISMVTAIFGYYFSINNN